MFRKKKKEEVSPVNLLTLVPQHSSEWREEKDGKITLLKPKFKTPFLQRKLSRFLRQPQYEIRLDEIGSFVWRQIDGKRTIREIGELLHREFGEKVEPPVERLGEFIRILDHGEFVTFKSSEGEQNGNG